MDTDHNEVRPASDIVSAFKDPDQGYIGTNQTSREYVFQVDPKLASSGLVGWIHENYS